MLVYQRVNHIKNPYRILRKLAALEALKEQVDGEVEAQCVCSVLSELKEEPSDFGGFISNKRWLNGDSMVVEWWLNGDLKVTQWWFMMI